MDIHHGKDIDVDTLHLTSQCARCRTLYYEKNNIGSWQCFQHPGRLNGVMTGYEYGKGKWDCCGYDPSKYDAKFARGCQPADHRYDANLPYIVDDELRLYR